jgi:hypothetical protein
MTNTSSLSQDRTFRKVVVGSTGLGIALMLASLAAVQFGKSSGLQFQWHWSIAVVMVLGAFWNWRFWNVVWAAQDAPDGKLRGRLMTAFAFLFALGIGTFLYPMRFVASEHHLGISRGLVTAVLFLGILFWLLYKLGRGFLDADKTEAARQS